MDDKLTNMNLDDSLTESLADGCDENADDAVNSDAEDAVGLEKSPENSVHTDEDQALNNADGDGQTTFEGPEKDPNRQTNTAIIEAQHNARESALREAVYRTELPRHQIKTAQDREMSMLLKAHGRALSEALMTIAGTRQRSGRFWLTCAATFIVIVLLIVQVYYRHRELNLGYELSAAISEREALLEANRKLRIELRVLSRRERLEPLAGKQLGLQVIQPEQVLILETAPNIVPEKGGRLDGLDNVKRIGE
jgi:cell division protein FtsL